MQNEQWLPVEGYEGYEVSNLGRVRSLDRIDSRGKNRKGKILRPADNGHGYLRVRLCKEGKMKGFFVHRLVCQAFKPNPNNLPQVNHLDEDPMNNRVENLEWCDSKYNNNYASHNERVAKANINHPSMSKSVSQFTLDGKFVKTYPSLSEAVRELNKKSPGPIGNVLTARRKTAYGYLWRYADSDL